MLSRKDFNVMSDALCHASPMFDSSLTPAARNARMKQWRQDVAAVAAVFKMHNPRFDFHRFYEACGVPPEANHD